MEENIYEGKGMSNSRREDEQIEDKGRSVEGRSNENKNTY